MGRKSLGILSQSLLTVFLFLVGALTKSKPQRRTVSPHPRSRHIGSLRQLDVQPRHLRDGRDALPLPGLLQHRMDAAPVPVPARGHELQHPRERDGRLPVRAKCHCVSALSRTCPATPGSQWLSRSQTLGRVRVPLRARRHRMEDIHD